MKPVTIYSRGWCSYCAAAKALLADKQVPFEEIDIELHPEARSAMVERAGGRSSVPQIFIGGQHIGGSDDLHLLERTGKLDALLA